LVKIADGVKGFLDETEGRALYDTAAIASTMGPCLEIGSYCGKSTVYLGLACKTTGGLLYAVDHHRGSEEQQPGEEYFDTSLFDYDTFSVDTFGTFRKTLAAAKLEDSVVPIVSRSVTAARYWGTALSMVFIDGGHAYETVIADYEAWTRHIISGGFLLIHDIFEDPADGGQAPYRVYKKALESGDYTREPQVKSLGILKKK